MCGIVGILDLSGRRDICEDTLITMRDAITHRGPDESGNFISQGVALGHRRLAIIDVRSGQQPLSNHDESVTLIFNGEIFNYRELSQHLKERGYHFRTQSDTESILHAWEEWGENCVDQLRGQFAFAIWDKNRNSLFLARDRMGIKPLLYAHTTDGFLIFASEHKALLAFPGIDRTIQDSSVESYFALGYIPEPDTIYESIKKLPAGHTMLVEGGKTRDPKPYWDIPFEPIVLGSQAQAQAEMIERLKEAIGIRMIAEVPLGAFLSGGVDSSSVVALMSEVQSDPVATCSIAFADRNFNESEYADLVAKKFATDHHAETVDSNDYGLIDTLVDIYDEPYADSSALPTYQVCKLARKHVTVALSGDGADEMMSGYRRHRFHLKEERVRAKLPLGIRRRLFGSLASIYPKADWAPQFLRAKSTFQALSEDSVSAYFHSVSQNNDQIRNRLFSNEFKARLDGFNAVETFRHYAEKAPSKDPQALIQYIDAKTYLVDDILTKVDRASMAHSLEVRVPMLDHKFVEWVSGIGNQYKYDGRTGKALLKKSMEKYLPQDILYRKKMGFSVPLSSWFRGPLKDRVTEVLEGRRLSDTGYFNQEYLREVNRQHQSRKADHSTLIWTLLMFDGFIRKEQNSR